MSSSKDNKVCKNKKCQKILPAGYKYKYCEACRTQHAYTAKKVIKGVGSGAASLVVLIVTRGKIKPGK